MSPRSEDEGGFLDRWSRRKRAGDEVAAPEEQSAPDIVADEITPEEIAALPPPEEITLATDMRPFLRRGVPQALKNAALRRVWMLNPAIRDHKDLAVDYAWDWNTPGGVPGFSGEVSPKGVADLIARMNPRRPADHDFATADEVVPTATPTETTAADRVVPTPVAAPDVMEQPDSYAPESGASESSDGNPVPRHGGARPI